MRFSAKIQFQSAVPVTSLLFFFNTKIDRNLFSLHRFGLHNLHMPESTLFASHRSHDAHSCEVMNYRITGRCQKHKIKQQSLQRIKWSYLYNPNFFRAACCCNPVFVCFCSKQSAFFLCMWWWNNWNFYAVVCQWTSQDLLTQRICSISHLAQCKMDRGHILKYNTFSSNCADGEVEERQFPNRRHKFNGGIEHFLRRWLTNAIPKQHWKQQKEMKGKKATLNAYDFPMLAPSSGGLFRWRNRICRASTYFRKSYTAAAHTKYDYSCKWLCAHFFSLVDATWWKNAFASKGRSNQMDPFRCIDNKTILHDILWILYALNACVCRKTEAIN